jgi:hypothetical protein
LIRIDRLWEASVKNLLGLNQLSSHSWDWRARAAGKKSGGLVEKNPKKSTPGGRGDPKFVDTLNLIFLWLIKPHAKSLEAYDNSFWEKSNSLGEKQRKKENTSWGCAKLRSSWG